MYTVDLYLRVRLACHVDGLSVRRGESDESVSGARESCELKILWAVNLP